MRVAPATSGAADGLGGNMVAVPSMMWVSLMTTVMATPVNGDTNISIVFGVPISCGWHDGRSKTA